MLSCKFVSLLLLAFVALAVAGTLQSTLSLKVPVLVAEGGARPARRFHFRPCQASVRKLRGDESTWKLPPLFMLGSNHYKENDRIVAEIVWWAPRVAEQLRSICTRVREKLATRSAQLLASLDPARLGRIERDWTQKSTAGITPLRCEPKSNAWTLRRQLRILRSARWRDSLETSAG